MRLHLNNTYQDTWEIIFFIILRSHLFPSLPLVTAYSASADTQRRCEEFPTLCAWVAGARHGTGTRVGTRPWAKPPLGCKTNLG